MLHILIATVSSEMFLKNLYRYRETSLPIIIVRTMVVKLISTRHLWCVVSQPIIITKCTDGKHGNYNNYDLTIMHNLME